MNPSNSSKKREPDITITKFLCKLCPKNVSDNDSAILCDLCQTWIHIKCKQLNYTDYQYLQGSDFFFKLGFTPYKAEQPLRGTKLQEKKHKKD